MNTIIDKHKPILKIRLGSGGLAKVTPIKIVLNDSKKPIKVNVRSYATDLRKFFDAKLQGTRSHGISYTVSSD